MGCFDNLIGIQYCESEAPLSSKYLKDGGITLSELNTFAGQDYADGIQLGEEKIKHATDLIVNDIHNHFSSKYKAKTIKDNGRIGYYNENMQIKSSTDSFAGIDIKINNRGTFTSVYVKDIELFTDYSGEIDIFVYDLYENKILDTFTLTSVANEISVLSINKTYSSDANVLELGFLYDTIGINSYKTTVNASGCKTCSINAFTNCDTYTSARGVYKEGSSFVTSNMKGLGHTAGMSIKYAIECDFSKWLCLHSNRLAIPIIYKASSEIITYAMYNTERTNYNTMDKEVLKERRDFYELQYREQMDAILKNMDVPTDNVCFECKQKLTTRQLMP